jgi:putative transcriptional regulator
MDFKGHAPKAIDKIMTKLGDALAYAKGVTTRATAHQINLRQVDVTMLPKRLGMSQGHFAATFGFSVKTVRNWERGVR